MSNIKVGFSWFSQNSEKYTLQVISSLRLCLAIICITFQSAILLLYTVKIYIYIIYGVEYRECVLRFNMIVLWHNDQYAILKIQNELLMWGVCCEMYVWKVWCGERTHYIENKQDYNTGLTHSRHLLMTTYYLGQDIGWL